MINIGAIVAAQTAARVASMNVIKSNQKAKKETKKTEVEPYEPERNPVQSENEKDQ